MTDNLRIWSQVEKTDPDHTKKVNQRGGFTAISAAYQIKRATETFGPVGEGWGYDAEPPIFHENLLFVPVTLWHSSDRSKTFGPMYGGVEWKDKNGRPDSDAAKKATTDALTKLLSQLGFNADVFLGRFDDSKYVDDLKEEFAGPNPRVEFAVKAMADCTDEAALAEFWTKNAKGLRAELSPADWSKVEAAKDEAKARLSRRADQETPFDRKAA